MLGSVDPDNVQMAEVDTLFIHQRRAGTALGAAAGPPGCTGRRLLPSAVCSGAELSAQDGCFWSSLESHKQQRENHREIIHSVKEVKIPPLQVKPEGKKRRKTASVPSKRFWLL